MKQFYKNNGFTLIEIIVGINIGFLLLIVLVSFFLFSTKFVSSSTKKMDERQNINDFLLRFESTLRKADHFNINQLDSTWIVVVDDLDTISIDNNSFSLMKLYEVKNIEDYKMAIAMQSGELLSVNNGVVEESTLTQDRNLIISSGDILEINIQIMKNNNLYSSYYINPYISINRFRNIAN